MLHVEGADVRIDEELGRRISAVACAPSGMVVCAVSSRSASDVVVVGTGTVHSSIQPVTALAVHEGDGGLVIVGASRAGAVAIDTTTRELARFDDEEPQCAALDASGLLAACGVGRRVHVVQLQGGEYGRLDGHRSKVTDVAFQTLEPHLACSSSEDRTFRVWDLAALCCVYESCVLCAAPLVAIASHHELPRLAVAAADGRVWVHEWLAGATCRQLCCVDLDNTSTDSAVLPLALGFHVAASALVVVTTRSMLALHVASNDVTALSAHETASHASVCATNPATLRVAVPFAFGQPGLYVGLLLRHDDSDVSPRGESLSFFASPGSTAASNSPLLLASDPKRVPPPPPPLAWDSFNKSTKRISSVGRPSLPVVFHARIKSSGYGASSSLSSSGLTRRRCEQSVSQPLATVRRRRPPTKVTPSVSSRQAHYPIACGLLDVHQPQHDWATGQQAITSITCSSDARFLAVSVANGPTLVQRLPLAVHRGDAGETILGRSVPATQPQRSAATFSHDCRTLLTTAADGTVAVWPVDGRRCVDAPILAMRALSCAAARFFYLDRFILCAKANSLQLHAYRLGEKRSAGSSKLAFAWSLADAQNVTAIACVNSELSPLVLTAASNRSVHILDAAAGRVARVIIDAHGKPVHTVAVPRPLPATQSIPQHSYDLFATAAADGVATVWDLRAQKRAARFSNHLNRREPVGLAFSPCMRYLATGSEDKHTYLYDLRTSTQATRHRGHADVVSCVEFNPLYPQFISGSYDGALRFYTAMTSSRTDTSER